MDKLTNAIKRLLDDKKIATKLKEVLSDIDVKVTHLEDIEADNRALILKLIKQNNQIVKFLQDLEIQAVPMEEEPLSSYEQDIISNSEMNEEKVKKLQKFMDDFMERREELKEFEEELEKHRDKLTPGQIGDA